MNDEPAPPDRAPASPTIAELQLEAHRLIDQLAYVPGSAKLLLGCLAQLRMFADYKGNRRRQLAPRLRSCKEAQKKAREAK